MAQLIFDPTTFQKFWINTKNGYRSAFASTIVTNPIKINDIIILTYED